MTVGFAHRDHKHASFEFQLLAVTGQSSHLVIGFYCNTSRSDSLSTDSCMLRYKPSPKSYTHPTLSRRALYPDTLRKYEGNENRHEAYLWCQTWQFRATVDVAKIL